MTRLFKVPVVALALLAMACEKQDGGDGDGNTGTPGDPAIIERSPEYVNANLVYYGSEGLTESDGWILTLYTDMETDGGYPVGPGQSISLSFNAEYNPEQTPDLGRIAGTYGPQSGYGDFSAGTFIPGEEVDAGIPGQEIILHQDSFFAEISDGSTEYEADLLREGSFTITDNGDGSWTIEGVLVGTDYEKRYVHYTGPLDPVDRSGSGPDESVPNSTLTADLEIAGTSLTKAKILDYGPSYGIPSDLKQPYKKFVLFMAEETVDLTADWPAGTGRLLRVEVFVSGTDDMNDGIPAGTYEMAPMYNAAGGIVSTELVPFRIVPGVPDRFTDNSGTWYQELTDGAWTNYARLSGGTITVTRDGDAHELEIRLTDCSDPAFDVTCNWTFREPIPAVDRNYFE